MEWISYFFVNIHMVLDKINSNTKKNLMAKMNKFDKLNIA
jgi:hypothetical protein